MFSLLFVPALDAHKLGKALGLACRGIILDLEDSIAEPRKDEARRAAVGHLQALHGHVGTKAIYVRINGYETPHWREDLQQLVPLQPKGLMVPKVESIDALREMDELISDVERRNGTPAGATRLALILETALGVSRMDQILGASNRVCWASLGMADLTRDLGISWESSMGAAPEMFLSERLHLAIASRAAGREAPWDSVYMRLNDPAGLVRDTEVGVRLGYQGKAIIHPSQIEPVNQAYGLFEQEVERARRIVAAYRLAQQEGLGAIEVDGALVDRPVVQRAEELLQRLGELGSE